LNRLQKYAWIVLALALLTLTSSWPTSDDEQQPVSRNDEQINKVAQQVLAEGRQVFRFDTFGDEDFWGGTLRLHQGFRPDGKSAAVLIPPAFGLAGMNMYTWTGWGSVTHWNAFVANLEMHGKGSRKSFPK
jgi:hypothetical protein